MDPETEKATETAAATATKFETPDDFAAWVLGLRSAMYQREADFFYGLLAGENGLCPWHGAFACFEDVIGKFKLTSSSKYTGFKRALEVFDEHTVRELGVEAVIKMVAIEDVGRRGAVLIDITTVTQQRGCQLTGGEVTRRIQLIAPVVKETRSQKHRSALERQLAELRAENTRLRALLVRMGVNPDAPHEDGKAA